MTTNIRSTERGPHEEIGRGTTDLGAAGLARAIQAAALLAARSDGNAKALCRVLLNWHGALAVTVLGVAPNGQLTPLGPLVCGQDTEPLVHRHHDDMRQAVSMAVQGKGTHASGISGSHLTVVVAIAGKIDERRSIVSLLADADAPAIEFALILSQTAASELQAHALDVRADSGPVKHIGAPPAMISPEGKVGSPPIDSEPLYLLVRDLSDETRIPQRWQELAKWTRQRLQADWVFLGGPRLIRRNHRLRSANGPIAIGNASPLATQAGEVLAEAALLQRPDWRTQADDTLSTACQQVLRLTGAQALWCSPLKDTRGATIGSVVSLHAQRPGVDNDVARGPTVTDLEIMFRWMRHIRLSGWSLPIARLIPKDRVARRRRVLIALATALLLGVVPLPTHVPCGCQLEPNMLRFVPAPFEGLVRDVLVQPGTIVSEGQVLARMDRRELDWQLAAKEAEAKQASKDHDAGMANGDTSAAQVAQLEMDRLHVEIELLRDQSDHLEIRSPLNGVVLAGDSKRLSGARVPRGEVLFEAAPLDRLQVELEIRPIDLPRVQVGQEVAVHLDALPFRTFRGSVQSICPRAETRHAKNVFVALVELTNNENAMRPGMRGQGQVHVAWQPLAWTWFQRLANSLHGFMIS